MYTILVLVAGTHFNICLGLGSKNQKAGVSQATSIEHMHIGTILTTAPGSLLLLGVGSQDQNQPQTTPKNQIVETSVRYEIEMNNQYKADNRGMELPSLTTTDLHKPSDKNITDKLLQEVHLLIPTAQEGEFHIKKTTIEHIPVIVARNPFNIVTVKPGSSYTLPMLPAGQSYRPPLKVKDYFSSDYSFTIPADSTLDYFKVYLNEGGLQTDTVAYFVNILHPGNYSISKKSAPTIPQICLAPGESCVIHSELLPKTPSHPSSRIVEYTLDHNDYVDEKIKATITKTEIDETTADGTPKVRRTYLLTIPTTIERSPSSTFTGGKFTVNIKTSQFAKSIEIPGFTVKIEKNA